MLLEYVDAALRQAKYKILPNDDSSARFAPANVPGPTPPALEACCDELRRVLEDWILIRLRQGQALPTIAGISRTK